MKPQFEKDCTSKLHFQGLPGVFSFEKKKKDMAEWRTLGKVTSRPQWKC